MSKDLSLALPSRRSTPPRAVFQELTSSNIGNPVQPRSPFKKVAFALSLSQAASKAKSNATEHFKAVVKDSSSTPLKASSNPRSVTFPRISTNPDKISLADALIDPSWVKPLVPKRSRLRRYSTNSPMFPLSSHLVIVDHCNRQSAPEIFHFGKAASLQTTDPYCLPFHQVFMGLPPPSRGRLVQVPQSCINSPPHADDVEATRLPVITFQSKKHNAELGMRVGEILSDDLSCAPFDLIGAMDTVFHGREKYIVINIAWPGYQKTFRQRVYTQRGTITRGFILFYVTRAIMEFASSIQSENLQVARGFEKWRLGKGGIRPLDLVITTLLHRGGENWQPTIFAPLFTSRSSSKTPH